MHDATRSFVPPPDAIWKRLVGAAAVGEGVATGFIDWEYAAPGDMLGEVGMAARYWVPLVSDERRRQIGAPSDDPGPRLRRLCDAYGLSNSQRLGLLDATEQRLMLGYETQRVWAAEGRAPFSSAWANGSGDLLLADRNWLIATRDSLASQLS